MTIYSVFLALCFVFFANAFIDDDGPEAGFVVCGLNDELCGPSCFDSNDINFTCSQNGTKCPASHKVCAEVCYDPAAQVCLHDEILCPKGQILCGYYTCYDPKTTNCTDNGNVCPIGLEVCGNGKGCFDPKTQECLEHKWEHKVCNIGDKICGESCYDPRNSSLTCEATGEYDPPFLCTSAQRRCAKKCYDPQGPERCYQNGRFAVLCKAKGEDACGNYDCYDTRVQKCFKGDEYGFDAKVCKKSQELCGGSACYWAHNETCFKDDRIACPNEWDLCGRKCYDPKTHRCVEIETKNEKDRVVCGIDEEICGKTCYNPKCFKCYTENGTSTPCGLDMQGCGFQCYDPTTQKCLEYPFAGSIVKKMVFSYYNQDQEPGQVENQRKEKDFSTCKISPTATPEIILPSENEGSEVKNESKSTSTNQFFMIRPTIYFYNITNVFVLKK